MRSIHDITGGDIDDWLDRREYERELEWEDIPEDDEEEEEVSDE